MVAAILAATVLNLVGPASASAEGASLEYAVKANYLYKFGPFVEWPPRVFASLQSPFNVCVFGEDPFGPALDSAVRGQSVGGHRVAVRRLSSVSGAPDCHVLYVGRSRSQSPAEVLKLVRGLPILTVTDEGQGVGGGMVQFVLRDGRVRFGLDVAGAEASGLSISSKLQALATNVRRGGG
ncbi:MAG: putative transrane protein [Phenylobacterium sp.]|nr:putative transrane protein [Phenylobacterium sp.]